MYIPAHEKNGQTIGQQLKFRAFVNHPRGKKKSDIFDFTAWGKLADKLALSIMKGKELHLACEPESYYGKVRGEQGKGDYIMNSDGTPLMVLKTGFRITKPRHGDSTQKQIDAEIKAAYRPPNWNDGAQGAEDWKAIREATMAKAYDGSDTYGFAKVYKVNGANAAPAGAATAAKAAYGNMAENIANVQSGAVNPFATA